MGLIETYQDAVARGDLYKDPAQVDALTYLETVRNGLENPPKRCFFSRRAPAVRGLYLWGGVGQGKSMVMDMFVDSLTVPTRRVHFHAFMQEMHASLHDARKSGFDDAVGPFAIQIAREIKCLAFDEMQITDITDAMIVGRLFEKLIEAGVTIVTTSNRHPNYLYKDGLNRQLFLPFIAYLKEHLDIHEIGAAKDYRMDRLQRSDTYFYPLDEAAKTAIDQTWATLAGGPGKELSLDLGKRVLKIPTFRNGIARASFDDLCGRALGPKDYLVLAEAIKVLILENVPQLSKDQANEAKRFVTLVDTLYEAKVVLIVSADVPADGIYTDGRGAFEFARTVSRLQEMQSVTWQGQ